MLPTARRLKAKADFSRVLEAGLKEKIGPLLIFHLPHTGEGRFGFVVSKKVDKRATQRNYLRRVLDALVVELLNEKGIPGDTVLMVLYSPEEAAKEFRESLTQWVEKLPQA
jgi:ribonuclease P protein component